MSATDTPELPVDYTLVDQAPDVASYRRLREISGLSVITREQAMGAIAGPSMWTSVVHQPTGEVVAMGRVFGDGGWYFHVADMATDAEHQRRGLGRSILARLLARVHAVAPPNPSITLSADPPGRPLYRSMGFVETAPHMVGMRYQPS